MMRERGMADSIVFNEDFADRSGSPTHDTRAEIAHVRVAAIR